MPPALDEVPGSEGLPTPTQPIRTHTREMVCIGRQASLVHEEGGAQVRYHRPNDREGRGRMSMQGHRITVGKGKNDSAPPTVLTPLSELPLQAFLAFEI